LLLRGEQRARSLPQPVLTVPPINFRDWTADEAAAGSGKLEKEAAKEQDAQDDEDGDDDDLYECHFLFLDAKF